MSDTVNLLAFGTDVIGSADTGGSGSGGHTIENPSGTDMEQRSNLQFTDAVVADDSTNDRTEISIVRELMQAEFDELTPEEQNRGVIVIKDANPSYLPSDNAVSVTADGVKTYSTLLNELYALVDIDKVTRNSSVVRTMATGEQQVFRVAVVSENLIVATYSYTASTTSASPQNSIHIKSSGSNFYSYLLSGTVSDVSSAVPASGVILTLYYNILSTTSSGGSGGHTIKNTNGTDLPQEDNLQFVGVYTEDDSANNRTKVNVVRTMTKAQMDALSAAEKVGFIRTSDEPDNPYQDGGSVSVTADGVKTASALLNELFALIDSASITENTVLCFQMLTFQVFAPCVFQHLTNGSLRFSVFGIADDGKFNGYSFLVSTASRAFTYTNSISASEISSQALTSGFKFIIYYK